MQLAGDPEYVGSVLHKVARDREDAKIFYVEVTGESIVGEFYDIDNLPENVVDTQVDFIHQAAKF